MIAENQTAVPASIYPELLRGIEQRTHAEIDAAHPEEVFLERGQEWGTDPAFPNVRILRVWAITPGHGQSAKISYQTIEGHTSTAYLDTDGEAPGVHHGEDKYTDEPVSVIWDPVFGKWLQITPTPVVWKADR